MTADYVRFAGTEVINHERLAAYIANGIRPQGGTTFDIPTCEGLSSVLYPSADFTTPLGDQPPWYDANDPDTWDFAGVLALDVTGLDDTTRTVALTQTVEGNGLAGRAIRGPQTVAVTAVLIGRTSEGVRAGLAWLRRVLHGSCDADEQPCGQSGTLETFSVCPGPITGSVDLNAPVTDTLLSPADGGAAADWVVLNGDFAADAGATGTLLVPYDQSNYISANGVVALPDSITGGGPLALPDMIVGGGVGAVGQATLAGKAFGCTEGPVSIAWTMRATSAVKVQAVLLDNSNTPVFAGPTWTLTNADAVYEWDLPIGVDLDVWRPALVTAEVIAVNRVVVGTFAATDPEDCIAPYRRNFPVTATTSGPVITDTLDVDCAELLTVEWVWESGSPYRYGTREPVILSLGFGDAPTLVAPGASYNVGTGAAISAAPWNCTPPAPVSSCAIDPAAPAMGVPPAYPVIVDNTRPRITTQPIRDMWANIGPELIPSNEGVLTIELVAGIKPVVGLRVRVWDDADPTGVVPSNCDFAYEFLVDYIPANGVMTIDGAAGTITTLCGGLATPQDAAAGVRGAFGGPVQDPVVRCDRRYLVRAQWLDTYPRTATPYYTSGQPEGTLHMNLYVTNREG